MPAIVPGFSLRVPGEPRGQARARYDGRGHRMHKTTEQESYERDIILLYRAAGSPRLPEGPYAAEVQAWMKRPGDHFRADGSLTPKGMRTPFPLRKPDADNFLKLIDVLVKLGAVPDDAKMVTASVVKRWAVRRAHEPGLVFVVKTLAEVES